MRNAKKSLLKKSLALLCVMAMFVTVIPPMEAVADQLTSGTCGEDITWSLDSDMKLTISGSGYMNEDNDWDYKYPWKDIYDDNDYIFSYEKINSVVLNEGIKNVGDSAFSYCYGLKTVNLPNSLERIDSRAFEGCNNLESINIPNGVTNIGSLAFNECEGLRSIEIPDSVTTIDHNAFSFCLNLSSVKLPSGLKEISDSAFEDCNLKSIEIPSTVKRIGDEAFWGCDLTEINIPNGVTNIEARAFAESKTGSVDIPASVISMESSAFDDSDVLTNINVDPGNMNYASVDGALLNKSKTELIFCPDGKTNYTIPSTVKIIGDSAFDNGKLTGITIPSSVTSVGERAFAYCNSLTSVSIPSSVTSIGDGAFAFCDSLKSISFPSSVTSIVYEAMIGCESLTSVTIPTSVTSIGKYAFVGCDSLIGITIPTSVTSIDENAFGYTVDRNFTIYGKAGSYAETFAKNKGYKFVAQSEGGTEPVVPAAKEISNCAVSEIKSKTYTGKTLTPDITIKEGDKTLTKNTDYTVTYKNSKGSVVTSPTNAGKYSIVITGKGNYTGTITETFTINRAKLTKATLSATSYTFNGKVKKPSVTAKAGSLTAASKITKDSSRIDLIYASGRKNVGTYKVTIKGKGNYTGTITKSFKINPKGVSISSLSKSKKAFTVKWKKPSSANRKQMTGYQIRYSTSSKMTTAKKVTVKNTKTTSKKISKLKTKKKYYVQIRTYKTVKGKKYYSGWSKAKSVKTR